MVSRYLILTKQPSLDAWGGEVPLMARSRCTALITEVSPFSKPLCGCVPEGSRGTEISRGFANNVANPLKIPFPYTISRLKTVKLQFDNTPPVS